MTTTKTLSGKVALVTGGSRGIGAASALALADQGADVAISYISRPDKAEAVVAELRAKGVRAKAFKADQENTDQVRMLVAMPGAGRLRAPASAPPPRTRAARRQRPPGARAPAGRSPHPCR